MLRGLLGSGGNKQAGHDQGGRGAGAGAGAGAALEPRVRGAQRLPRPGPAHLRKTTRGPGACRWRRPLRTAAAAANAHRAGDSAASKRRVVVVGTRTRVCVMLGS